MPSYDPVARQLAINAGTIAEQALALVSVPPQWTVVDANTDALDGAMLSADTTDGSFDITLPSPGSTVTVRDNAGSWATNPLTIIGNGALVAGGATFVLDVTGYQVTFTFIDGAWAYALQYLYGAA